MAKSKDSGLTFGAWRQLLLGHLSDIDILTDPYTNGSAGTVNFYALQYLDVGVRIQLRSVKARNSNEGT